MNVDTLFNSGAIALVVLAVLALEALALRPILARRGLAARYPLLLAGLAAGGGLAAALGAGLAGWPWAFIALFLALSFLAHAIEVRLLLRQ